MKNFDYSTKTLVKSFSYSTIGEDRNAYTNVMIDGRNYIKHGILQAVTVVGNLYEDSDGNRVLLCGIAKQHPCDTKCNKEIALEVAQAHAMFNPDIVINTVPKYVTDVNFRNMISWYIDGMELEFIKTRQEIEKLGLDPKKYNR